MSEVRFIELLRQRYESRLSGAADASIEMRFGESPSDRSKTSAWLALDKANRLVYLQVWSTGEAEVESGAPNRIDRQEHHNFTNAADLDAVLSDALAYLNDEQLNLDG